MLARLSQRATRLLTPARRLNSNYLSEENSNDTIVQLCSGQQRAGVAVIRISGPQANESLKKMARRQSSAPQLPRTATLVRLHHPHTSELLESQALSLFFPGPKSFTGEDCVEFHVHGSPVLVTDVLESLILLPGFRLANAGEFTRRAFYNGKMDLTQVEGLADLLDAETQQQRRQAQRQMDGDLGKLYERWRMELAQILAHIEAIIDFSDSEADVGEQEIMQSVSPRIAAFRETLTTYLADGRRGELMRRGLHVAIVGSPNAGKSSLLNRLARRPVAIVSSIPGTTRDVLEVAFNVKGFPFVVADTAGLRETTDEIEIEGVRRARNQLESADLKVAVFDVSRFPSQPLDATTVELVDDNTVVVFNKVDLLPAAADLQQQMLSALPRQPRASVLVSCETQNGFESLLNAMEGFAKSRLERGGSEEPLITRARHRAHLKQCVDHIDACQVQLQGNATQLVLAAEELRQAIRALGCVTGRVVVEDLLDIIFKDFCIGK